MARLGKTRERRCLVPTAVAVVGLIAEPYTITEQWGLPCQDCSQLGGWPSTSAAVLRKRRGRRVGILAIVACCAVLDMVLLRGAAGPDVPDNE